MDASSLSHRSNMLVEENWPIDECETHRSKNSIRVPENNDDMKVNSIDLIKIEELEKELKEIVNEELIPSKTEPSSILAGLIDK